MRTHFNQSQKLRYLCCFICTLFFTQVNAQTEAPGRLIDKTSMLPDTSQLKTIRIDPFATAQELISSVVDSIVYLPLQTDLNSKLKEITRLEVTNKYYIIWDNSANSILLFLKNGKFFKKITNKDENVMIPYQNIGGFTVNEQKKQIIIDDTHSQYVYYYTLDGDFIRYAEKLKEWGDQFSFNDIDIRNFSYSKHSLAPENLKLNSLTVAKGTQKPNGYFSFNTSEIDNSEAYSANQFYYNNLNNVVNFSFTYNYNMYSVDNTGKVSNTFRFILPEKNRIPSDFLTNTAYKGNRIKYVDEHPEVLFAITDFYKTGDNITFRTFGAEHDMVSVYNLKTGKIVALSAIISDKSSYMLPIIEKRIYALNTDGSIIAAVDAGSLLFAQEQLSREDKNWENSISPALKTFFKGNFQQNPVLTLMYLKKKF